MAIRRFRRGRSIFLVSLAVYLAVIAFGHLPDRLILFPTRDQIDPQGAKRCAIPFENGELEVWTAQSRSARERGAAEIFVLRFYGNADRAERWVALEAEAFDGRAVEIWGVNYPGFGGSSGPASLRGIAKAGIAAFDVLKTQAGNKPIGIFGASIGTTVALHVAANREPAGLVLHNPPALRQMILRQFGWWNLWLLAGPIALQIPPELDNIANGKRIHCRAIFLLAQNDEIVSPKFQHLVVDSFAGEKRIIDLPGAHHNSPLDGNILPRIYDAYDWLLPR